MYIVYFEFNGRWLVNIYQYPSYEGWPMSIKFNSNESYWLIPGTEDNT